MAVYKLKPTFKDYLWGGTRLKTMFNGIEEMPIVAEAWVLSAHKDGMSMIGEQSLQSFWEHELKQSSRFPVMAKLIDAKQKLSIQVHPNDELGFKYENENGKTEVWYVLDAVPGAYLYYGFNQDMTPELVRKTIADGAITHFLNRVMVKKGDVVFVPAGTVHAIGEGILIAEIQQNSNITYRLFDFERRDANGQLRPLHIEESLRVLNYQATQVDASSKVVDQPDFPGVVKMVCTCQYFSVMAYELDGDYSFALDDCQFYHVLIIEGSGLLDNQPVNIGDSFLSDGKMNVAGKMTLLLTSFS